ncbi:hypothetical protein M231_01837 [Tremella mesenterica]|uniref:Uncharacterized protein n=1 Tax=Tremella mesenterica TaxID=5217 RepID=A0A4Q1BS23_TREME|nr:uncharacterized protein TREMEDRAFT_58345 [Tremella mesenterica DSM 1558]EIW72189.1 hypothetical protein TREMEDRAFT_58345 [Tremella mesenterica DSM 1558]RXK40778.1 hypothetical protein M231_01837 [Tremella mesenterica]
MRKPPPPRFRTLSSGEPPSRNGIETTSLVHPRSNDLDIYFGWPKAYHLELVVSYNENNNRAVLFIPTQYKNSISIKPLTSVVEVLDLQGQAGRHISGSTKNVVPLRAVSWRHFEQPARETIVALYRVLTHLESKREDDLKEEDRSSLEEAIRVTILMMRTINVICTLTKHVQMTCKEAESRQWGMCSDVTHDYKILLPIWPEGPDSQSTGNWQSQICSMDLTSTLGLSDELSVSLTSILPDTDDSPRSAIEQIFQAFYYNRKRDQQSLSHVSGVSNLSEEFSPQAAVSTVFPSPCDTEYSKTLFTNDDRSDNVPPALICGPALSEGGAWSKKDLTHPLPSKPPGELPPKLPVTFVAVSMRSDAPKLNIPK